MSSESQPRVENLDADLVVVGGGGAGLAAAAAAAEKGLKDIIVLEARKAAGGNAAFVGGIFASESQLQRNLGIDARRELLFKKAMDYAHWKTDPRLVHALIERSGDTIRWLEEKGLKFDRIHPLYPNQTPMVFHFHKGPGKTGAAYVRSFVKHCGEQGVQILRQTRAKRLLTGDIGQVAGVEADAQKKVLQLAAKSVVMATGGFSGNSQLLKKYLPAFDEAQFHYAGIAHQGDGLSMALEIGAATEGMAVLEMTGPAFPGSMHVGVVARQPNTMWVNKGGRRFVDESVHLFPECANSLYRQPQKTSYTLFDEAAKQRIFDSTLKPLDALILGSPSWAAIADKDLRKQAAKGRVMISDSWSQIAAWIGADLPILEAEIDEYNRFCDQGFDDVFFKDRRHLLPLRNPPFYAIQCGLVLLTTHGGVKINHRMEVLDNRDLPIPGLYAAGVETGGTDSDTYDAHLTGHSFGFSINSGRIAGENAANYIRGKSYGPA